MLEILVALGIFVVLAAIVAGMELLHGPMLLVAGAVIATLGLAVGVLMGIGYHFALYRVLQPTGALGSNWWWHPSRYHRFLPDTERGRVISWFYAGVVSMVVVLAGCALVLAGVLTM